MGLFAARRAATGQPGQIDAKELGHNEEPNHEESATSADRDSGVTAAARDLVGINSSVVVERHRLTLLPELRPP